jgi:DNA polymerase III epsilon subunit-like protein
MKTIFYDLETTDLNPVGQILNYAFVEIDENWIMRSCYRGTIKLSRLQLPNPAAICATQTDILEHNRTAEHTEAEAMAAIQKYISDIVEWDDTRLVGYNSNKFDLPFLRTSMIRNGLNPYFGGSVKYGDLLHVVRRLCCDNPDFVEKLEKKENGKPSMKLESIARAFGLLTEEQKHESLSDVMLTIKVAEYIHKNYGIDVRNYSSYEVKKSSFDAIKVFPFVNSNNEKTPDDSCYMALLEQNKTQALWINLKLFEEGKGKDAVFWYNKNTSAMYVEKYINDESYHKRAEAARASLSHVSLANFFEPKNCDVEQFIFMMPISDIGSLYEAVWMRDLTNIKRTKSKFASQLYLRYLSNTSDIHQVESQIKDYAVYRYGGKMKIGRENQESKYEPGVYSQDFHPTYNELLQQIDELSKQEKNSNVMTKLKQYYEQSVITSLAGEQLKTIVREKL